MITKPFLYLTFSERMAVLAVRENSQARLWQALLAQVVEDFRWDYRENLMVLSVVYHSAKKIGADAKELFQRAADLAGARAADYLRAFSLHPRSIRSMGYREVIAEDGFRYQRDW
jgi:predicted proteasome-type protease